MHIPTAPRKAPLPGALRRMGVYLSSRHFANAPAILFAFRLPGLRPPKERRHAPGVMDTPFPFITFKSGRAATSLYLLHFHGSPDIPYTAAHFSLKNGSAPAQSPTRDRRPCPSIRTTSDRVRLQVSFRPSLRFLLCTIVVNIFPEDIYDGIAQTIYLPISSSRGFLFDIGGRIPHS